MKNDIVFGSCLRFGGNGCDDELTVFADSSLQTFPPSEAQGKISASSRPPRDADGMYNFDLKNFDCHSCLEDLTVIVVGCINALVVQFV